MTLSRYNSQAALSDSFSSVHALYSVLSRGSIGEIDRMALEWQENLKDAPWREKSEGFQDHGYVLPSQTAAFARAAESWKKCDVCIIAR